MAGHKKRSSKFCCAYSVSFFLSCAYLAIQSATSYLSWKKMPYLMPSAMPGVKLFFECFFLAFLFSNWCGHLHRRHCNHLHSHHQHEQKTKTLTLQWSSFLISIFLNGQGSSSFFFRLSFWLAMCFFFICWATMVCHDFVCVCISLYLS